MSTKSTPLIIDDTPDFYSNLEKDSRIKTIPPHFAKSNKEAQLMIANEILQISAVVINPFMKVVAKEPDVGSVLKFSKNKRLDVPIYALVEKGQKIPDDFLKLGIKQILEKPLTYSEILKSVSPQLITYDPQSINTKFNSEALNQELQIQDQEFVPILAKDFVAGAVSHFSLYVRTTSGRYIKVLHANDTFDPERVTSYLKKGVQFFHIRKEDQENYLLFSQKISSNLIHTGQYSIGLQATHTLKYGQETMKYLNQIGVSESRLHHAMNFSENMQAVATKMAEQNETLNALLTDIECYEHSVSISMLTSLVAHASGIESQQAVNRVGVASLFHDVALPGTPAGLEYSDVSTMSEEHKQIYYSHPRLGSEIMEKISGTHATIVQAILLHHERRGKKAFDPSQDRPRAISGLAEMIGIADEYLRLIHQLKVEPSLNIKSIMEREIFSGFSVDTVEAFNKVFYPSKRPSK